MNKLPSPAAVSEHFSEAIDRIAREHLLEADRKLADLAALRNELTAVIGCGDSGTVADCRIIDALGSTLSARA